MKKSILLMVGVFLLFFGFNASGQNTLEVFVFHDLNGNGVDDDGDFVAGLGAELVLYEDTDASGSITGGDLLINHDGGVAGLYTFSGLSDNTFFLQYLETTGQGFYKITELNSANGTPTTDSDVDPDLFVSAPIALAGNVTEDMFDLGLYLGTDIGNLVFEDIDGNGMFDGADVGIDGVTVTLLDNMNNSVVTDADGNPLTNPATTGGGGIYEFLNLIPGDYRVEFSLPAPVGANPWYPTEYSNAPDGDITDNDSNADPNNSLRSHLINLSSGTNDESIDAGFFVPIDISDIVFCDENGNGIFDPGEGGVRNITVTLVDVNTGATALDADGNNITLLNNTDGTYSLDLIPPGTYRIEYTGLPADYEWTRMDQGGDDCTDSDVDQGTGITDQFDIESQNNNSLSLDCFDAGAYQLITISGNIWFDPDNNSMYDGEGGPGNVLVELYDMNGSLVQTDNSTSGTYTFIDVPPGMYNIVIPGSNFLDGAPLAGTSSCELDGGSAGDMVDNDDNGPGGGSGQLETGMFQLNSNCEGSGLTIDYIDFCFFFDCNEENPLANTICNQIDEIDVICDLTTLEAFCSRMPDGNSGGSQPNPLCPDGGGAHNISWFAFVAGEGTYDITVTPFQCTEGGMGNVGVQIGAYTDCTFDESVACNPNCSTDPLSIPSTDLVPGETYYFFIDGCSGSVCSYTVTIEGTYVPPTLDPTDMCILENDIPVCDDADYCPDTEVIFEVQGEDADVMYFWNINVQSGGPFNGDLNPITEENNLILTFENEGVYEICFDRAEGSCNLISGNIPFCRTVTIMGLDDEEFEDVMVCDIMDFDVNDLVHVTENGDGLMGWQEPSTTFVIGDNMTTIVNSEGCMYDQMVTIDEFTPTPPEDVVMVVCNDDLPLMVDNTTITELTFGGNTTVDIDNILLTNETDKNGCDSLINLMVERLVVTNGMFDDQLCLPEGVLIDFNFADVGGLSTDISFMTFEWTDPDGNVVDDGDPDTDPTTVVAPNTGPSGTYTLTITIDKDGATCPYMYDFEIDFDGFLPPQPDISGPMLTLCESDSVAVYTAMNGGDAFTYTWDFPGNVADSEITGDDDEILTINWAGTTGGTVSVIGVSACGDSEEQMIEVTIVPQIVPGFTVVNEVCIDSISNIEYAGDDGVVDSYTWDFDGGVENNGTGSTGPGVHGVSWTDGGTKTITLSLVDENGCESTVTTETVEVIEPITPPVVNCNPNTGEVSFTWDDVDGATGYDVIVTSTDMDGDLHEGILDGNTFTVTGLQEGETVTIQIVAFTNDACQMVVGVGTPCTSQNCDAPMVDLSAPQVSLCLDAGTTEFDITADILSGETGSGVFSGPGITDEDNGTFDPNSANIGVNNITYTFMTDDPVPCIGTGSISIEVIETPVASFMPMVDTICITETVMLSYNGTAGPSAFAWDYGPNGNGNGGPNPEVSFTSDGLQTITLSVEKDGCTSEEVIQTVFVEPELEQVVVNCEEQMLNSILFGWNDIVGATGYLISINGGPPMEVSSSEWLEDNLNPGDSINLEVTVLTENRCGGNSNSVGCIAEDCPNFSLTFDEDVIDVCNDGSVSTIPLLADVTGGTEDGTYTWTDTDGNDLGGNFDLANASEGSYNILLTYSEDNCEITDQMVINVTQTPVAGFSVDNTTICVGEMVTINNTGSNLPNQDIVWTSGGELVLPTATPGVFTATFNTVGSFDITQTIENGDCVSTTVTETVTVEPELFFDEIDCAPSLNQISFSWDPVDCATDYEVFIGGVSQGIQTTTSIVVMDLIEGQEVDLEVVAISDCACGDVMMTKTCEAKACPPVEISLSAMGGDTEFCTSDNLVPVQILDEVMNSEGSGTVTWVGTGVDQDGMFDPTTAGVGTHLIYYEFNESEGCDYLDSITFVVNDAPGVSAVFAPVDCYDQDSTALDITPTGGDGNYDLTINGSMASASSLVALGTYDIIVTDGNQCTAETSVTITGVSEPMPSISGATELETGQGSQYSIEPGVFAGNQIDNIVWTANGTVVCDDPGCFSITETPTENTTYIVTVFYNNGCEVSTTIDVEVMDPEPISIVEVPNIISPNDDGQNDEWVIFTNDANVIVNSVNVFDRWGNKVFEFQGPVSPINTIIAWNGKWGDNRDVIPGVYVYTMEFIQNERLKTRSGDITIIR